MNDHCPTPYIGITGFMTAAEVSAVIAGALPAASGTRLLMCGVLLSNALLSGQPSDAPATAARRRTPSPASFAADPRCLNLVHYRPRAGANLVGALARVSDIGGPNCHGVQINATRGAPWPEPAALAEYRERRRPRRIVLQVGREAMAAAEHNPAEIARRCAAYAGIITDVLVDASEGLGQPLDAERTARYLDAIASAAPAFGLVAAGGLHAGNLAALLAPLLPDWGSIISIDAEGRLRDGDDRLDIGAAEMYLDAAMQTLTAPV